MKHTILALLAPLTALATPLAAHAQTAPASTPAPTPAPASTTPTPASTPTPAITAPPASRPTRTAPARHYASGSFSLYALVNGIFFANAAGGHGVDLNGGARGRLVLPIGLAVDVGLGPSFRCFSCTRAPTPDRPTSASVGLSTGVGLGWAFALTDHIALTPMVSYRYSAYYGTSGLSSSGVPEPRVSSYHWASLELALRVYVTPYAFIEPRAIAQLYFGGPAPDFTLASGFAFGVTL